MDIGNVAKLITLITIAWTRYYDPTLNQKIKEVIFPCCIKNKIDRKLSYLNTGHTERTLTELSDSICISKLLVNRKENIEYSMIAAI
jgi:hypothetical protein